MNPALSLSTVVFPSASVPGAADFAWVRRIGITCIELGKDHALLCRKSRPTLATLRDEADRAGVSIASLHAWTELDGAPDAAETARALGAGLAVVHCRHEDLVRDFDAQAEMARRYTDRCRALGIVPTVENSSRQPLRPFVRLFGAVPELRFTLDVKHACKPETLGLTHADYLRELGDRLANLHVCGINRARDPLLGDGTPPGDDLVDWRELAGDLVRRRYEGTITVEMALPEHLTAAEQERGYADLPASGTPENTLSQRLSAYAVGWFRENLKSLLEPT